METRPTHFGAAFYLFRRRERTARPARSRQSKGWRLLRFEKIPRQRARLWQPAGKIRARIARIVTDWRICATEHTISCQARRFLAGLRFRAAVKTDFFPPDNRTSSSRLKILRFPVPVSRKTT